MVTVGKISSVQLTQVERSETEYITQFVILYSEPVYKLASVHCNGRYGIIKAPKRALSFG